MKKLETLETITKGFASKRRIAILSYLVRYPGSDLEQIANAIDLGYVATGEHIRKMHVAGLVEKEGSGYFVLHTLTQRGKRALSFLRQLQ